MTETTRVVASRQKLAEGLELPAGVRTEVTVSLTPVGIVSLPTANAAFFQPKSPIPMPEGTVPALAAAWKYGGTLDEPSGLAISHLWGAKQAVSQAHALAHRRAEAVWNLAHGKPWPSTLTKGAAPNVWHRILRWIARTFEFDCDIPETPSASQSASALARFRDGFNARFDEPTSDSGSTSGAEDWRAYAICYQAAIADQSGLDVQTLRTQQAALRPIGGGTLVCDPRWSRDARMQAYSSRNRGRVEFLLFARHCDPLLDEETTPGESIYDDPNYAAKEQPFTAEEILVPDSRKTPGDARELYAEYVLVHERAMNSLLIDDDEAAYIEAQVERETAWSDYVSMSGDEEPILHESQNVELTYRDYWMTHVELVELDLGDKDYPAKYIELYEERGALWLDYESAGGFRKTKLHTEDPPQPKAQYWQLALKHTKHHFGVTAYNLALLSEFVYQPDEHEPPGDLEDFVKLLTTPALQLHTDTPRAKTADAEFPALFLPSESAYRVPLVFSDPKTDTQGICFANDSHAVLIFRGTLGKLDLFRDMEVVQGSFPHSEANKHHDVHRGFQSGLETPLGGGSTRMSEIHAYLYTTLRDGNPIFIAGHSLGGALAAYAACTLRALEPQAPITLYTFGQPRLCNQAMATHFHGSFTYYRYAYKKDVVPMIPISSTLRAISTYKLDELDNLDNFFDHADVYTHFGFLVEPFGGQLDFKGASVELLAESSYLEMLHVVWAAPSAIPSHSMINSYLFHAYRALAKEGAPSRIFLGESEQLERVHEAAAAQWVLEG